MDPHLALIVDDESSIREILSILLQEMGIETLAAGTGEEALSMIGENRVSVALVDIKLPGINGIEVIGEIKQRSPDTETIIMTSYATMDTLIQALRKDAYDYLFKPFDNLEEVGITVSRALEKRSFSLQNRQLLRDLEQNNEELRAALRKQKSLMDAGRAMGGIPVLKDLLDFFVGVVAEELGVKRVSLMLVNEKTGEMWIEAARGLDESVRKKVKLKVGDGIAGWVAQEGKPILVKDVLTDPRVKKFLHSTHSTSFISAPIVFSVPIMLQEKVLGVINVTDRRSGLPFDDGDMEFLSSLAGQAAVAIERTRQYEELHEAYEVLQAAQKSLVDSERINALGQLAAGVAHDFNNLLSGILGRVELIDARLANGGADLATLRKELDMLRAFTLQGAATVRRIQEFSRIRKDQPVESVDLNSIMQNALEMTRSKWKEECETKGIRIEVCLEPGEIPETRGNNAELTQVVSNLIFNSVEAMPGGGELTLKTYRKGNTIRLEVSDTGIGMSKEVKEKLFQPFFTTKDNGFGLGTSIVYGIVARHGGTIKVTSELGAGTTFLLTLPVEAVAREGRTCSKKKPGKEREREAKVLVVEDNEINREVFSTYLASMGHKPVAVSDGKEVVPILEKEHFDLVITDLSMPGLSGWQVAQGVKKRTSGVPVILISGWAVQQDDARIRESGVDFVLQKPCTFRDFKEVVQEALSSDAVRETEIGSAEENAAGKEGGTAVP
ncbi:MAG TPA: response regulator [Candidatus Deferrimicrobiaceae bacterium]|nr:response regulator [Candidatus Deferrimicrobiaceae bacterium]